MNIDINNSYFLAIIFTFALSGDDDDTWSETEEDSPDNVSHMDTMLTSPTFIEPQEQSNIYSIAPAQNNTPLSIFTDKNSEELSFPNIFCGEARPDNNKRPVPIYYSEICKSEVLRNDRRVAQCTDNLFFKVKKIQMKRMLGQVQIALRKCKTNGQQITAGICKDTTAVNQFIHKDIAYKFLAPVRGSPP